MVKRLYGTVNGADVIFKKGMYELWEADIPALPVGEYYVNLIAEDEAGNKGFYVGLVLTYSIYGVSYRWAEPSYRVETQGLTWAANEKTVELILGEEKYITIEVFSNYGKDDFVITKAEWELFKGEVLEDSGICRIDKHLISSLVQPREPWRFYDLVVTFTIGEETLKGWIKLEVVKP